MLLLDRDSQDPTDSRQNFADQGGGPPEIPSNGYAYLPHLASQPHDPFVMAWAYLTGPKLTPSHDAVLLALASHFTAAGGWRPITQAKIAEAALLSRQLTNKRIRDLVEIGLVQQRSQPQGTHGKGAELYRLAGEDCGWQPASPWPAGRQRLPELKLRQEVQQMQERVQLLEELVLQLAGGAADLPESLKAIIESIPTPGTPATATPAEAGAEHDPPVVNEKGLQRDPVYAPSPGVDPVTGKRVPGAREAVTESQHIRIANELERTGLAVEDLLASWPDIQNGTPPPRSMDPADLTKSRANLVIKWLARQADRAAPVPSVEDPPACNCDGRPEADPEAASLWRETLAQLKLDLPKTTFDTWLEQTEAAGFNDHGDLVVQVPSVFTIAWLEQRLYQTILSSLRRVSERQPDVRFQAAETCPIHGVGQPDGASR